MYFKEMANKFKAKAKEWAGKAFAFLLSLLRDILFIKALPGKSSASMPMMEYLRFTMNARFTLVCLFIIGLSAAVIYKMWFIQIDEH